MVDTGDLRTIFHTAGRHHDLQLQAGTFGLFNAGVEVGIEQIGGRDARRIVLELDTAALVRQGLVDDDVATRPLHSHPGFGDSALALVLRQMVREIEMGCPNGALFAESLSVGVALHLRRTRGVKSDAGKHERGKLTRRQWACIDELIDSGLSSDLSLATLTAAIGLSKPHFVRLFRNTTGTSPHQYVIRRRAERARQLVQGSNLPLVDIAAEVGFANQSHLNRVFLQLYGVTPRSARLQADDGPPNRMR